MSTGSTPNNLIKCHFHVTPATLAMSTLEGEKKSREEKKRRAQVEALLQLQTIYINTKQAQKKKDALKHKHKPPSLQFSLFSQRRLVRRVLWLSLHVLMICKNCSPCLGQSVSLPPICKPQPNQHQ